MGLPLGAMGRLGCPWPIKEGGTAWTARPAVPPPRAAAIQGPIWTPRLRLVLPPGSGERMGAVVVEPPRRRPPHPSRTFLIASSAGGLRRATPTRRRAARNPRLPATAGRVARRRPTEGRDHELARRRTGVRTVRGRHRGGAAARRAAPQVPGPGGVSLVPPGLAVRAPAVDGRDPERGRRRSGGAAGPPRFAWQLGIARQPAASRQPAGQPGSDQPSPPPRAADTATDLHRAVTAIGPNLRSGRQDRGPGA